MSRLVMMPIKAALAGLVLLAPAFATAAKDTKDPVKEKADLQAAFKKLVDKTDMAKADAAKNGKAFSGKDCLAAADEFAAFGRDKKSPEGLFNAGVLYENCDEPKRAEAAYREAINVRPGSDQASGFAPAHVNLGEMVYKLGDVVRAGIEFDTALKIDPKNAQAYNDAALVLIDKAKGDKAGLNEAIGKLRRALAIDADSMPAYTLLALVYFNIAESDRSKLDLAELVCKQAADIQFGVPGQPETAHPQKEFPQILNTLGLIKLKKKNVTGALGEFRKAVDLDPKYVEAQLNIGAITLSARDYTSAETAFKAVLDAKPTNPQHLFDATMGMGVAVRGQRRVDEAEQWYTKAKAIDPKNCAVIYNLGVLYQDYRQAEDNSNLNKAKALFNDFLACGKADPAKLDDGKRRIKDVDDTFKALAEAKKMEEESKKMQEEQAEMIKKADEQACQYWKTQVDEAMKKKEATQPPPNDKCGPLPAGAIPPVVVPAPGAAAPAAGGAAPAGAAPAAPAGAAPAAPAAPAKGAK